MRRIIFSILFLAAALFFLPQFVSSHWVKNQIEEHLTKQLGGEVKIDKLSLSWFKGQNCQNILWKDPFNGITIYADQMHILENLIDCIRYKEKPLNVQITGAKMHTQGNFRFLKKKREKELEVQFSPIYANLDKGIITFKQMQLQINKTMQIFSNGKIDLGKQRMEITLGIPPQTLKKVFKEAKNLPDDFLLEIPITTNLSSKAFERALIGYFLKNYAKITSLHK